MKKWIMCACPECEKEFVAKLEETNDTNPNDIFGLKPLPEELTCPYCGIKNDVYAIHFLKVEL
jgi:rubredoxin